MKIKIPNLPAGLFLVLLLTTLLITFCAAAHVQFRESYKPKDGFVPTDKVAVAIAEAVLFHIYGKEQIEGEKPYKIKLVNGVWQIKGTLGEKHVGGTFEIEISKSTGEILHVIHGE